MGVDGGRRLALEAVASSAPGGPKGTGGRLKTLAPRLLDAANYEYRKHLSQVKVVRDALRRAGGHPPSREVKSVILSGAL